MYRAISLFGITIAIPYYIKILYYTYPLKTQYILARVHNATGSYNNFNERFCSSRNPF